MPLHAVTYITLALGKVILEKNGQKRRIIWIVLNLDFRRFSPKYFKAIKFLRVVLEKHNK